MDQCGSIVFFQDIGPDLQDVIRTDTEKVSVKCGMMELAQGQSIRNHRFTCWLTVWNNVGGIEKLLVSKSTECALVSIGIQDALPEGTLMQALPYGRCDILASGCVSVLLGHSGIRHCTGSQANMGSIVHCDREGEPCWIVTHNEDGPGSKVPSRDYAMEIDERQTLFHCEA